jgi:hypothetical protein
MALRGKPDRDGLSTVAVISRLEHSAGNSPLERVLIQLSLGQRPDPFHPRPPRIRLERPVRFRPLDAPASLVGTLSNISVGGAHIRAGEIPEPGTLLAFGFLLRHEGFKRVLRSMARVVWTEPRNGFGLRLVDPPPTMVQTIEELVARRLGPG